jgi:hypothetical protein
VNSGLSGTNYDQSLDRWWVAPYVGANSEKGYFVNQVTNEKNLIWRDVESFDVNTIKNIQFRNNSNGQNKLHIAFKIGGSWYVSNEGYSRADYKYQGSNWIVVDYDWTTQGARYSELFFDEGVRLEVGDQIVEDLSGAVSAVGLYCDGNDSTIRFDSFNLNLNISSVSMPDVFVEKSDSSNLDLNFNSVEGVTYSLLVSDDLVEWFRAEEGSVEGDNQVIQFTDAISDKRFYKILLKESK